MMSAKGQDDSCSPSKQIVDLHTPESKDEKNSESHFMRLKFFDQISLKEPCTAALMDVFNSYLPMQKILVRQAVDDDTLDFFAQSTGPESEDSLFVIDLTPMKNKQNGGPIPSYKKGLTKVFDGQTPDISSKGVSRIPRARQSCWNCEGDHGLKDCKEPRNYTRIRQQKEIFQKKTDRYHADLEQKLGHIVPGQLSDHLREALGLGSRDLPFHIYRMRVLGYPPGWLEEAKITHSGLQLFDSNGEVVHHSDESEVEQDNSRIKFDVRRIVAFPGFNEPPLPGMVDDSKFHKVPPYSDEMSRKEMVQQLQGTLIQGYRRKKLKFSTTELNSNILRELAQDDIDSVYGDNNSNEKQVLIEQEDGQLADDTDSRHTTNVNDRVVLVEESCPIFCLDSSTEMPIKRTVSPTLDALQQYKKHLMNELHVERLFASSAEGNDQTDSEACVDQKLLSDDFSTILPTLDVAETSDINEAARSGVSKITLGTPILKTFTPFKTLPNGAAFSLGVSDVIHFENLPHSTGKYEQMKSLLTTVRHRIIDHHHETDEES
ncbi:zinc finger CCHC domain-containing protein 8 homolog [Anopheles aquasalis]|uniref:zinc finger CCHC domain-containing protein 8 homolog n=1 Tax=Anopheles aquasalis TaxID=42839 RepID=UPI00215AF712|nr:zinc finger CCHC domain-containing protein 8 homolog [Anopheles aquasalis]